MRVIFGQKLGRTPAAGKLMRLNMMRKSLIAGLGFLGLVAAGTMGGSTQASAYGCGYWNNWCRPACGYWNGWCAGIYAAPGFSWGYSRPYWGNSYGYRSWGGSRYRGHHAHRGGGHKHSYKRSNRRYHR